MEKEKNTGEVERYLAEKGEILYRTNGVSMRPLIKSEKDAVRIVRKEPESRCKKYDIALYRRRETPERLVLHRIIGVTPDGYTALGDNCLNKEVGIREEDVVGVLSEVIKPRRVLSADRTPMKIYGRLWVFLYPARRLWMVTKSRAAKLLKRILG